MGFSLCMFLALTGIVFGGHVLKNAQSDLEKNMERISSGLRINHAGDDPSGLLVSEKIHSQVRGLFQANRNVEDAISFIRVTEGYLEEVQLIVHKLRELALQAGNGIYTSEDRAMLQNEAVLLIEELGRSITNAQFNGLSMLNGKFKKGTDGIWFHIGPNQGQRIQAFIGDLSPSTLKLETINIDSPATANDSLGILDKLLVQVIVERANLGSYDNRLEHIYRGNMIIRENNIVAESKIKDADISEEIISQQNNLIKVEVGTEMVSENLYVKRLKMNMLKNSK